MREFSACLAEGLGTFFLCFAGIAAILSTQAPINSGIGLVGIALAHGLALSVAVNCFGGVSGAHHNPAVTIATIVTGRKSLGLGLSYIGSQLIGAWIAAALCGYVFPEAAVTTAKLGIPLPADFMTPDKILLVEFVLTFLLVIAIFGTAIDERGSAVKIGAFGIGLTVTFDILAGGMLTGASMNPARSFGPTLALAFGGAHAENHFDVHWMYWLAPVAGAVAAALVYDNFIMDKSAKK